MSLSDPVIRVEDSERRSKSATDCKRAVSQQSWSGKIKTKEDLGMDGQNYWGYGGRLKGNQVVRDTIP